MTQEELIINDIKEIVKNSDIYLTPHDIYNKLKILFIKSPKRYYQKKPNWEYLFATIRSIVSSIRNGYRTVDKDKKPFDVGIYLKDVDGKEIFHFGIEEEVVDDGNQGRKANESGNGFQSESKFKTLSKLVKFGYKVKEIYSSKTGKSYLYNIERGGKVVGYLIGEDSIYTWYREHYGDILDKKSIKENRKPKVDMILILDNLVVMHEVRTLRQVGSTFLKTPGNYDSYMKFFGTEFQNLGYMVKFNVIVNDFIMEKYKWEVNLMLDKPHCTFCDTMDEYELCN